MLPVLELPPPEVTLVIVGAEGKVPCNGLVTVIVCCTCGTGWYSLLPAWLASITHVPAPVKEMLAPLAPELEHAPAAVLEGSMLNITELPEPPPVADTADAADRRR